MPVCLSVFVRMSVSTLPHTRVCVSVCLSEYTCVCVRVCVCSGERRICKQRVVLEENGGKEGNAKWNAGGVQLRTFCSTELLLLLSLFIVVAVVVVIVVVIVVIIVTITGNLCGGGVVMGSLLESSYWELGLKSPDVRTTSEALCSDHSPGLFSWRMVIGPCMYRP